MRSAIVADFPALSPLVSFSLTQYTEGILSNDRNASLKCVYPSISPLTDMSVLPSGFFSQLIVMLCSFIS